jgi:hypothetical protein
VRRTCNLSNMFSWLIWEAMSFVAGAGRMARSLTILTYYERFLVVVGCGLVCRGATTPIVLSMIATNRVHYAINVLVISSSTSLVHALKTNNISFIVSSINILSVFPIRFTNYHSLSPQSLVVISRNCVDVWGFAHVYSIDSFLYHVTFLDHFSKYGWLYPMKLKSDVALPFLIF